MVEQLKIIIPTCDKYIHLVEGLMYTVNKFWPLNNKFIILGYKSPKYELLNNWEFISLGSDTGPMNWSNDLIKFFAGFKDEYFINMIDDTLMTRPSDINKIESAFAYMLNNKCVKKCFLHGSLTNGDLTLYGKLILTPIHDLKDEFLDINQEASYRTSLQSSIWNTNYFKDLLKPNLTPWAFETQHTINDGVRIITTKINHPTMYSHLYRKNGSQLPNWYCSIYEDTKLCDEDIEFLKKMLKLQ